MIQLQYVDIVLPSVYLFVLYSLVLIYSKKLSSSDQFRFRLGFAFKVLGCFFFWGMYEFYYQEGDTFLYFKGANRVWEVFTANPIDGIRLLLLSGGENILAYADITMHPIFISSTSIWTMTKCAGLLNLFCFNNYFCLSLFFTSFSFLGTWGIYRVFRTLYPNRSMAFFILIFLIPSCLVWTSGILKDSICLGAIGLVFHAMYKISQKKKLLLYVPSMLLFFILLFQLKSYLAYTFFIALTCWLYLKLVQYAKHTWVRRSITFSMWGLIILMIVNLNSIIHEAEKQLAYQESISRIKGYHLDDKLDRTKGTASYNLGPFEYSAQGIIKKAPVGVITGLFRPFIWEGRKALMLLMGIENLAYLSMVLLLLVRRQFWQNLMTLFASPEFVFCLLFVVILGLIVGVTTYNYGLLMRLKTPLLPFFGAGIVVAFEVSSKSSLSKLALFKKS